ncbi:MAG: chromosome segregation protein SMC [Bacillota bacterium]
MNLNRIEIYGFKSFADKVAIDFNSNITGIVGPNGCGKSNVADAVRWVLGEQTASVLRCKKMPEVIFSGTENRKSLSYCEVSLFLDNTQKFYKVDYEEVIITRKLDKSGESEYFINRAPCRWKDIIELFRDSGIGREGYSIIGQGKVEEILSARPESRRKIFEEAAGITAFRARRVETERNLERTRLNMERINDMRMEIERSLQPLEEEAKTANKAKELKKRMKMIDIYYFLHQTEHSADERARLTKRVKSAQLDVENAHSALAESSREYNISMIDIENSDIFTNKLRDQIAERMVIAERKMGETRLLTAELTNLKKKGQEIATEIATCTTRQADREQKRIENTDQLEKSTAELAEQEAIYAELEAIYKEMQIDVKQQEMQLEATNEMVFNSSDKLHSFDKDETKLAVELSMLSDSLGKDKEEYKEKTGKLSAVKKEIDRTVAARAVIAEEKAEKEEERASAMEKYNMALSEMQKDKAIFDEKQKLIAQFEYKIASEKKILKDYNNYAHSVRFLMNEANKNPAVKELILGTVGEVISVPKDLQVAIEVALGGSIQNIIVERDVDATQLIKVMRERNYGRATFLPVASIRGNFLNSSADRILDEDGVVGVASDLINCNRKFSNIISNLLGRTIIVEDSETAMRINKRYNAGIRMVTISGSVFAPSGAITGGSAPSGSSRILSKESEVKDLETKLARLVQQCNTARDIIAEATKENQGLEDACKVLSARITVLDKELTAYDVKLEALNNEAEIFNNEIEKLLGRNGEISARMKAVKDNIDRASADKDSAANEKVSADDFLNEQRQKLNDAREELEEKASEYIAAKNELTKLTHEVETYTRSIAENTAEISAIQIQLADAKTRNVINERDVIAAESKVDISNYDEEDRVQLESMRAEVAKVEEHKKNMQQKVAELNITKEELNKKILEVEERRVREESALERMMSDVEALTERISTDYDMDYNSALEFRKETAAEEFELDVDKAAQESASLRRKIERLGPLNELAESRFVEEQERFSSMQTQYVDLEKASTDLKTLIKSLTSEMTEKFSKSFIQINANFQEVFCELFGGGRAELVLETEDGEKSVLEAGIEIIAEPPGKKPQRISLLSGGERAMTAIAILFSIIKLKPMPFSLLDEIEAALDENNATLFAQYLKKFASRTQFIVVTHRKPTMALSDVLYGVTNQEKGVSTLVSVKLEDAIKTIEEEKK